MAKSAQQAGLIGKEIPEGNLVAEMEKLMVQGKLLSKDVLPFFAKNMREFAKPALQKALESNRVAMNRMVLSLQEAANILFQSGFGKGLTEFFNTVSASVVDMKGLWEALGKILGSIFSLLSDGVKAVTPTLVALSNVIKGITDSIGLGREYLLAMIGPAMWLGRIFNLMPAKVIPFVGQVLLILESLQEAAFWAEELMNLLVTRDKKGLLYDPSKGVNTETITSGLGSMISEGWFAQFASVVNRAINWIGTTPDMQDKGGVSFKFILGADAEKLGVTLTESNAFKNAIDTNNSQLNN